MSSLLAASAARAPDAAALVATGRPELTYGELVRLVAHVGSELRTAGVEPRDRVGLVVPNGPEAASAFLAVSSVAACAPLNPAYGDAELEFYLGDLGARFAIVAAGLESPVRAVASRLGIRVLELGVDSGTPAGEFVLHGLETGHQVDAVDDADAVALVLHTSGTTARPKIVPLTHRNLLASATAVASTLALDPADRCLNVMPLFHIHGLVAGLLASLGSGASVVCAPGFHPLRFFEHLSDHGPTWYTAVPTMHQSVLARVEQDPGLVRGHHLRFVRSSSSALPVAVLRGLEAALGVPVVEAYGMTEAAHQMASNPLPPGTRRPGSVGLAAGPEIAVLGPEGTPLVPGKTGEVAIRGENVFQGYEGASDANASSFVNGWFRTGDEGSLDEDGYLTLRGRIKEIINRGGEKVGPAEVDDVLTAHPAVAQAVTFAVPDPRLGEEVAAAVVLREEHEVMERELQDFVVQRLAPFKVPRRIVFLDELPKGPTGKMQRIGLAERLGISLVPPGEVTGDVRPRNAVENEVEKIWADVLGLPRVGVQDDFFALGGDSILGAEAVARLRDLLDRPDLPLISIVRAPTVEAMVREIEQGDRPVESSLIPLHASGSRTPLFFVHGLDGDVVGYAALARRLDPEQPFYALRAPGIDGQSGKTPNRIEGLAAAYLPEIRAAQPRGPYVLGGFCMGSGVALELTHRLQAEGEEVSLLVLVDPRLRSKTSFRVAVRRSLQRVRHPLQSATRGEQAEIARQIEPLARARDAYRALSVDVPAIVLLSPDHGGGELSSEVKDTLRNVISLAQVPGSHGRRFHVGSVEELARVLNAELDRAQRPE